MLEELRVLLCLWLSALSRGVGQSVPVARSCPATRRSPPGSGAGAKGAEGFSVLLPQINVLLQAFISQLKLEGFALMADMVYVTQVSEGTRGPLRFHLGVRGPAASQPQTRICTSEI